MVDKVEEFEKKADRVREILEDGTFYTLPEKAQILILKDFIRQFNERYGVKKCRV